jgi:hypothetical protein
MEQYISKSAIMAEIRKYIKSAEAFLKYHHNRNDKSVYAFEQEKLVMCELLSFLNSLEAKEIGVDVGSPEGDIGVKTIWDGDKIVSNKALKGE